MGYLNKNTMMIAGSVIIIGAALVIFLFGGGAVSEEVLSSSGESALDSSVGRDLLVLLAQLKTTKLNTSIFDDPLFVSLQDFGVAIAPQPVGRRNPFAAFEGKTTILKSGMR